MSSAKCQCGFWIEARFLSGILRRASLPVLREMPVFGALHRVGANDSATAEVFACSAVRLAPGGNVNESSVCFSPHTAFCSLPVTGNMQRRSL